MVDVTKRAYSVKETAEILGVCYHTVSRKLKDGTIPHSRLGNRILITDDAIDALLNHVEVSLDPR